MNDYIESPDGQRVRLQLPPHLTRTASAPAPIARFDGWFMPLGAARIDAWIRPETEEAA